MIGGASSDPFVLSENARSDGWNNNSGYSDVNAKTIRSLQGVDTSKKNLILITAGDSNMASVGPSAYTVVNTTVNDNLNIYDGAIYASADPMLGATYATLGVGGITAQVADKFITAGTFDRVICVSIAVGGATTTMWAAGGVLYNRLPVAMARLAARGITPATTNCTFGIVNQIGANEHGILQATFQANVAQTTAKAKNAGFSGKVFIPQYSILSNATDATIRAAQAAMVDSVNYFSGGDIDTLTGGTNRQADGTHLTAAGQASAATLIYNAMHSTGAPF